MKPVPTLNLMLLCLAIIALLIWLVPEPETCWLPPNAPRRGMYADCWQTWEIWS